MYRSSFHVFLSGIPRFSFHHEHWYATCLVESASRPSLTCYVVCLPCTNDLFDTRLAYIRPLRLFSIIKSIHERRNRSVSRGMDSRQSRSSPQKSAGGIGVSSQPHSPLTSTSTLPDLSHSSSSAQTALAPPSTWLPILESSNQLVLYNPTSHALTIAPSSLPPSQQRRSPAALLAQREEDEYDESIRLDDSSFALQQRSSSPEVSLAHHGHNITGPGPEGIAMCPFCAQPLPPTFPAAGGELMDNRHVVGASGGGVISRRAPNYFQFLEANFVTQRRPQLLSKTLGAAGLRSSDDNNHHALSPPSPAASTPSTPGVAERLRAGPRVVTKGTRGGEDMGDSIPGTPQARFSRDSMAQGYFAAFFREEKRLGMGANGSVHLCQVSWNDER